MASVLAARLNRAISWMCAAILYVTFGVIFFVLCTDVVQRYFIGTDWRWDSEIPELLLPWLVMAGVVLAAQHGAHIATTFLADTMHGRLRQTIAMVGHVAIIAAYSVLAFVTAQTLPIVADEFTPILHVPGSVTYSCLFIGFVLIALVHVGELLRWHAKPAAESQGDAAGAYQ